MKKKAILQQQQQKSDDPPPPHTHTLGNVLIGVNTTYIQKINKFRLVVCSSAYLPTTNLVYKYLLENTSFKCYISNPLSNRCIASPTLI